MFACGTHGYLSPLGVLKNTVIAGWHADITPSGPQCSYYSVVEHACEFLATRSENLYLKHAIKTNKEVGEGLVNTKQLPAALRMLGNVARMRIAGAAVSLAARMGPLRIT